MALLDDEVPGEEYPDLEPDPLLVMLTPSSPVGMLQWSQLGAQNYRG